MSAAQTSSETDFLPADLADDAQTDDSATNVVQGGISAERIAFGGVSRLSTLPSPVLTGATVGPPTILRQSESYRPFPTVIVTEPVSNFVIPEIVTIRFGTIGPQNPYPFFPRPDLGTISDPLGTGSFDQATSVFTESTQALPGQPDGAQAIINRLIYSPPPLKDGTGLEVLIDVSVNDSDGSVGTSPVSVPHGLTTSVQDVTNPLITLGPAQMDVVGHSANPFAGIDTQDNGLFFLGGGDNQPTTSAQIVITDAGVPTDSDGVLFGEGLIKTGVGTYTESSTIVYVLGLRLGGILFTTPTIPDNQSRMDVFTLTVADSYTGLSTTNSATTLNLYGANVYGVTPVTLGTGPDKLVLQISEDAFQGNALFTLSVDGVQQGGVQTAIARHGYGQEQPYTINGDFGPGGHSVAISFLNDNGKYGEQDRNLHVDGATFNGSAIPNSTLVEYTSSTQSIAFAGHAASSTDPVSIGNGQDTVLFAFSEDAYQGNAQFTLSVDGKQQGGIQTATASNDAGQTQSFAVHGDFGPGAHTETVNFLNDDYGGMPGADRNLYVHGVTYNGQVDADGSATLYSAGPVSFSTPATAQATLDTLTVGLTEDAYQGDAKASISINGITMGTPTVTFLNSSGTTQEFTFTGSFGGNAGLKTLAVSFLNDNGNYGSTDRNLYVKDLSFNGSVIPETANLYSNSTVTTTFQNDTVLTPFSRL